MRKKFWEQGIDAFEDHEVLEILLYFAVSQKNTNELAHLLLHTFGSLADVLNAPEEELLQVPGDVYKRQPMNDALRDLYETVLARKACLLYTSRCV